VKSLVFVGCKPATSGTRLTGYMGNTWLLPFSLQGGHGGTAPTDSGWHGPSEMQWSLPMYLISGIYLTCNTP